MEKGKIIVIEGTDGSGKATQTSLLYEKLLSKGIPCGIMSFPRYHTPTGRIISECYLGKGKQSAWFHNPPKLDPKIASLLYATDRLAAKEEIEQTLHLGINMILDRYVESNMAHQGGKLILEEKENFFKFLEELEYNLLKMPKPDKVIFLHMPTDIGIKLREGRNIEGDAHELNTNHLKNAEETYLHLAEKYNWEKISCMENEQPKSKEDISNEVFEKVKNLLNNS